MASRSVVEQVMICTGVSGMAIHL